MAMDSAASQARLIHLVTLACRDASSARRCLDALETHGRPDAIAYQCQSYEFGAKEGAPHTVCIVERWCRWEDLDALLRDKVIPALPLYNALLARPFDPAADTMRVNLG